MKSFIILSLVMTCNFAFASALTQNSTRDDIIRAIKESLERSPLTCQITGEVNRTASSSELAWDSLPQNVDVKINENKQPVIVFHNAAEGIYFDTTVEVTTSDDYLQVVKIEASQFYKGSQEQRNVGTIIKPVFETVYVPGKLYERVVCK